MSIDGIGKGAPPTATPGTVGVAGTTEIEKPLNLEAVSQVGEANGSEALGKLGRGEISIEQYLDLRASDALRHLEGKLPAADLAFIEAELRAQLESDPVLLELVRRATGMSRVG